MTSNNRLREAAILIASMDSASADTLLDEMAPEEAALVRSAVMELGDIDLDEQQTVVARFVHGQPETEQEPDTGPTREGAEVEGVELDPQLAMKLNGPPMNRAPMPGVSVEEGQTPAAKSAQSPTTYAASRPFAFLEHVQAGDLGSVLVGEHPQTTAIVVANLPARKAAELLHHLPDLLQTETLTRLARLGIPDAEVVRDVESELQSLLTNRKQRRPIGESGLAAVEAILRETPLRDRHGLIENLKGSDTDLASELSRAEHQLPTKVGRASEPRPAQHDEPRSSGWSANGGIDNDLVGQEAPKADLKFADLEKLGSEALALILHASNANTTLLALAGASHEFVRSILGQLPHREAGLLERKMQQLGPLRLDDIERAQQQLVAFAQQLIEDGKIVAPGNQRFAVAA